MMSNFIMVIGPVGAGKTSLIFALKGQNSGVRKTQAVHIEKGMIDTPGEYTQMPCFYSALMVTGMGARAIVLLQDATSQAPSVPPGFANIFTANVIGVISKIDLPQANTARAENFLRQAGVKDPIFSISTITFEGVDKLCHYLYGKGVAK